MEVHRGSSAQSPRAASSERPDLKAEVDSKPIFRTQPPDEVEIDIGYEEQSQKNMTHLPKAEGPPHLSPSAAPQGKRQKKKDFVKRNIEVCQWFTEGQGSTEKERLAELLKGTDEEQDPAVGEPGDREVGWHAALIGNISGDACVSSFASSRAYTPEPAELERQRYIKYQLNLLGPLCPMEGYFSERNSCMNSSVSEASNANRLNKLISKAGSVLRVELESLVEASQRRMLRNLLSIMENTSHPLSQSTFSRRLRPPSSLASRRPPQCPSQPCSCITASESRMHYDACLRSCMHIGHRTMGQGSGSDGVWGLGGETWASSRCAVGCETKEREGNASSPRDATAAEDAGLAVSPEIPRLSAEQLRALLEECEQSQRSHPRPPISKAKLAALLEDPYTTSFSHLGPFAGDD
ncbi:unnamed protein product [Lota lota]